MASFGCLAFLGSLAVVALFGLLSSLSTEAHEFRVGQVDWLVVDPIIEQPVNRGFMTDHEKSALRLFL